MFPQLSLCLLRVFRHVIPPDLAAYKEGCIICVSYIRPENTRSRALKASSASLLTGFHFWSHFVLFISFFVYFLTIFYHSPLPSGSCVPHYPCSLPKLRETLQSNHVAIDFCPLCSASDSSPRTLSPTGFKTWLSRPQCWQKEQRRAAF